MTLLRFHGYRVEVFFSAAEVSWLYIYIHTYVMSLAGVCSIGLETGPLALSTKWAMSSPTK